MSESNMNTIIVSDLAKRYAVLPYRTHIECEELEGKPWFTGSHPELPGCVADGPSKESVKELLRGVRQEFIQVLLDNGADVPIPKPRVRLAEGPSGHMMTINIHLPGVLVADDLRDNSDLEVEEFTYQEAA
jgi:predicted RNase H-like HicB family nuclease